MSLYGTFAPLAAPAAALARDAPRVCIVTGELVGPHKNGGLGTSMTGLAELLAAYGLDVTVLYTGAISEDDLPTWQARYRNGGITLRGISEWDAAKVVGPMAAMGWTNAYALYHILKAERFDVLHFNDTVGEGIYCFVAKRLGLAFQDTLLALALHSPTEWILQHNAHVPNWLGFSFFTSAERISIAAADLLWGPSCYLIDWIRANGYALPRQVFNQQYVIPTANLFAGGRAKCDVAAEPLTPAGRRRPKEIVFFGRLEERKGLRLFTSALTKIADRLAGDNVSVLFMGKPATVGETTGDAFIQSRAGNWQFPWRIESGFGQTDAVAYLRSGDRLAVMASPVDNSPCTVYEALQFGFPFIAARTGGIPELLHPDDHDEHLFDYTVLSLSERLLTALDHGIGAARPAISVAENQARWLGMHAGWRNLVPAAPGEAPPPRFGVLVDHAGTAQALADTVASVRDTLGDAAVAWAFLRRELAPLGAMAGHGIVIDELVDITPAEVIEAFRAAGAEAILAVRSGARLDRRSGAVFAKALQAGREAAIPAAMIDEIPAVLPALGGGAAQTFLEGEFETGGLVASIEALYVRLGGRLDLLDRERLYFGMGDELHAAGAVMWPIPEPLIAWPTGRDVIVSLRGTARRTASFARAPEHERYQMLGIGRHMYRALFPAAEPRPTTLLSSVASAALSSALTAVPAGGGRDRIVRVLRRLTGERGFSALSALLRRLRGQG
jgi:glycosyltransferase involved in cell wall biosynthesis